MIKKNVCKTTSLLDLPFVFESSHSIFLSLLVIFSLNFLHNRSLEVLSSRLTSCSIVNHTLAVASSLLASYTSVVLVSFGISEVFLADSNLHVRINSFHMSKTLALLANWEYPLKFHQDHNSILSFNLKDTFYHSTDFEKAQ